MIDKETFLKYTSRLEKIKAKTDARNKALQIIFPDSYVSVENEDEIQLILDLLGELMPECKWEDDSYTSDIDWFWTEYYNWKQTPEGIEASYNGKTYHLHSFSELYDMIVADNKEDYTEENSQEELKGFKDLSNFIVELKNLIEK